MYYRYNADELLYEVCDNRDRVVCMTCTEKEAKAIIIERSK